MNLYESIKKNSDIDSKVWDLIDRYESGKLSKDEVIKEVTKLNNGDKDEIKADLALIFKESVDLNEAYQVGNIESKLVQGVNKLNSILEDVRNKYITKDVITAAYKIQKAVDEGKIPNDSVNNPIYASQVDADGIPSAIMHFSYSEAFIDDKVFLYSPIIFLDGELYNGVYPVTVGDEYVNVAGSPVNSGMIMLTPEDVTAELDNLDGPQRDDLIDRVLEVLNHKYDVAKIYKDVCKDLASSVLKYSTSMGEARKQDIADKQRFVANAINDSEDLDESTDNIKDIKSLAETIKNILSQCHARISYVDYYESVEGTDSYGYEFNRIHLSCEFKPDKISKTENEVGLYGELKFDDNLNLIEAELRTGSGPNVLNYDFIRALNALYSYFSSGNNNYEL